MATYELISADSHIVEPPDLYASRIESGRAQLRADPVSNQGVVFTTLAGHPRANCGSRLLADPNMDQATQLDDAKQNRQ